LALERLREHQPGLAQLDIGDGLRANHPWPRYMRTDAIRGDGIRLATRPDPHPRWAEEDAAGSSRSVGIRCATAPIHDPARTPIIDGTNSLFRGRKALG